eukprot:CAMPEP_0202688910 /NCGR_PEP_ID=MMETSP1385-20130828/4287_1 /ASSEMBLY_ACC=CAM_ASM_000861 /TAXON_ID=933848 /ORGANISM="Elphidium margaritaceum" /LENGTH=465 /DNA_ID=CAMNT_0049343963 /DNA_START=27 /DNA_END=1421 /DNA_ORIENTATION=-
MIMPVRILLVAFFLAVGFGDGSGYSGARLRAGSSMTSDISQRAKEVRLQFVQQEVDEFTGPYAQLLGIALISFGDRRRLSKCTGVLIESPNVDTLKDNLYVLTAASCFWNRHRKKFDDLSRLKVEFGVSEETIDKYKKKKLESPDHQICSIQDVRVNHLFTTASDAEQHEHNYAVLTLNKEGARCNPNPSHAFRILYKAPDDGIYVPQPTLRGIIHAGYVAVGSRLMRCKPVTMEPAGSSEHYNMMKQNEEEAKNPHDSTAEDYIHDAGSPYFEPVLSGHAQKHPYLVGMFSHMEYEKIMRPDQRGRDERMRYDRTMRYGLRFNENMRTEIDGYIRGTDGISRKTVKCRGNKGEEECWSECVVRKETPDTNCFQRTTGLLTKKKRIRKYAKRKRWKPCGRGVGDEADSVRYLCGKEVAESKQKELSTLPKAYAELLNIFEALEDDEDEDYEDEDYVDGAEFWDEW